MYSIRAILRFDAKHDGSSPNEDDVDRILDQLAKDAVFGSFADLPAYWKGLWQQEPSGLVDRELHRMDQLTFEVKLRIYDGLFPLVPAGFQHLIGVLAGDLFGAVFSGEWQPHVKVVDVELPSDLPQAAIAKYRDGKAHSISAIRREFDLEDYQPLLAFSFKPRTGLTFDAIRQVTLGVLSCGFNVVELDTRNLAISEENLNQYCSLASEAAQCGQDHITRFSPNLSLPSHLIRDYASEFAKSQPQPVVIKVDGGLDGLSGLQAVREAGIVDSNGKSCSPVITCYPLLRHYLRDLVPPRLFNQLLALSGADVIYPGNRPRWSPKVRSLDAADLGAIQSSLRDYFRLIDTGWPMPTVAGGVHVGELHALYELLGPNTAMFLGGAVALHEDGPIEGARLCVKVLREAIERRLSAGRAPYPKSVSNRLIKEIESAYRWSAHAQSYPYTYAAPEELLSGSDGVSGWFSR